MARRGGDWLACLFPGSRSGRSRVGGGNRVRRVFGEKAAIAALYPGDRGGSVNPQGREQFLVIGPGKARGGNIFDLDPRRATLAEIERLGGSPRNIHDPVGGKWPAIVDADDQRTVIARDW